MDADDDRDLERMLALYRDACAAAGVEPLPDDEARELARRFHDLLAPAFRAGIPVALIHAANIGRSVALSTRSSPSVFGKADVQS